MSLILADNEPRSIAEIEDYGIRIRAVKKGPGSVEYGEEWLDDLKQLLLIQTDVLTLPESLKILIIRLTQTGILVRVWRIKITIRLTWRGTP